jgi:hypothetical protein
MATGGGEGAGGGLGTLLLLNLFRDQMKVGQNADTQVNGAVKQWQ